MVCLSVLEHLDEPTRALTEIRRVLAPGGSFFARLPHDNVVTRLLFALLGYRLHEIHPGDPGLILDGIDRTLELREVRRIGWPIPLYSVASTVTREDVEPPEVPPG